MLPFAKALMAALHEVVSAPLATLPIRPRTCTTHTTKDSLQLTRDYRQCVLRQLQRTRQMRRHNFLQDDYRKGVTRSQSHWSPHEHTLNVGKKPNIKSLSGQVGLAHRATFQQSSSEPSSRVVPHPRVMWSVGWVCFRSRLSIPSPRGQGDDRNRRQGRPKMGKVHPHQRSKKLPTTVRLTACSRTRACDGPPSVSASVLLGRVATVTTPNHLSLHPLADPFGHG